MLFARGLQVPLVHYNVKHADEYLEMRSTAYNNIKNTVGKIKALFTKSRFVEYVGGDNTKKNVQIYYLIITYYSIYMIQHQKMILIMSIK